MLGRSIDRSDRSDRSDTESDVISLCSLLLRSGTFSVSVVAVYII